MFIVANVRGTIMKTLSAIINEYKETKDESLKSVIWDFLMSEENNTLFKDIFVYRDDSEWVEYENSTRIKRLCPKLFVATQVFETIGDRYMCYSPKHPKGASVPNKILFIPLFSFAILRILFTSG